VPRRSTTALLLALALAACGGDDREEVRQAVRGFVDATNARDADRFCDHLVTQQFLEQSTGATGDQAHEACKKQISSLTSRFKIELDRLGRVSLDGDRARVDATIRTPQGEPQQRVFRLRKEDGDWRLAGGAGD
jgi:ketosteroid isomerase-like protein